MEENTTYSCDGFERGLSDLGIRLTETQRQQFLDYYKLLIQWNSFMNLTAITEFDEVVTRHFLDSLSLVKAVEKETLENGTVRRMIDVGTGAGFPGIPLKIVFPSLEVCLLDSLNKRVRFLREAAETLNLTGIEAVHGRAEDYGKNPDYRENFDLCVSRAVANLSLLSEYCLPFVKQGGLFVSYKSGNIREELEQSGKAVEILGGKTEQTCFFRLAETDMDRSLVCIRKVKATPKKYPRKAGVPAKEPLGNTK